MQDRTNCAQWLAGKNMKAPAARAGQNHGVELAGGQRQPVAKRSRWLERPAKVDLAKSDRGPRRRPCMRRSRSVGAPQRDHRIAVDAHHVAAMRGHNVDHVAEIIVEYASEPLGAVRAGGGNRIGHGGGVDDVNEEHDPVDVAKPGAFAVLCLGKLLAQQLRGKAFEPLV
ncbi:MAG: hypothetical protein E8A46_17110 [Bradyrhizobium sp.]|uniref:hypothetical protein n=1 Tax=Bradyrhizobium sp. TaxID=376 RepID=UPI0012090A38|nr:hypothetical protein [Bradyrhizobium sp.]THD50888.1 MAG: hypothetical protein E8A46_17110 [Bradyrhizobium sp.]